MWVLRTNTELSAVEVALHYKQLWMVEQVFRTAKSVLDTRPIFHKTNATIRGHVLCSCLALVLRDELFRRMDNAGVSPEPASRDAVALALAWLKLRSRCSRSSSAAWPTTGPPVGSCRPFTSSRQAKIPSTLTGGSESTTQLPARST